MAFSNCIIHKKILNVYVYGAHPHFPPKKFKENKKNPNSNVDKVCREKTYLNLNNNFAQL